MRKNYLKEESSTCQYSRDRNLCMFISVILVIVLILNVVQLGTPFSLPTATLLFFSKKSTTLGQSLAKPKLSTTTLATGSQVIGMSGTNSVLSVNDRKKAALFGLYVADATAMPVHWMYNLAQLQRDYGRITGYVKPKDRFDGSIMNLSNTGGGGRGSDQGEIIGTVINHGKKKYWVRGGNYHYHLGLDAGENTLEAQLTRLLTRTMIEKGGYDNNYWLEKYIEFMTTPGSHNDTYASTCHRMFFANHVRGLPPTQCADNDGHNTDAIDALTNVIPVAIRYSEVPRSERNQKIGEVIGSIRKSRILASYAETYSDILIDVLHGQDLRESIEKYGSKSIKKMVEQSRSDPMVACYIDSSFPALLFFAYKYADSPEEAILASANAGGENVARGSALGALVGAAHGLSAFPAWTHGLKEREAIVSEIDRFIATM